MKTKHEIRTTFRDMHELLIPAGTTAAWIEGGSGGYAVAPGTVRLLSPTPALFKHDSTYYYIWVNEKDLEA